MSSSRPTAAPLQSQSQAESAELLRLVAGASANGERDVFSGKRSWARYYLGGRMELTTASDGHQVVKSVVLHNISGGGVGFWCADCLADRTEIRIRTTDDGQPGEWLTARVSHSSLGLRGYLVGAAFVNSLSPEVDREQTATPSAGASPLPLDFAGAGHSGRSFRGTCTLIAAAGAAIGAASGHVLEHFGPPFGLHVQSHEWLSAVMIGFAFVIGGLFAWLSLGRAVRFLRTIESAIGRIGSDPGETPAISVAPFRELAPLAGATVALRTRWHAREDVERTQRQKLEEINLVKSNILNMVSHDLRTPLTSIRMYAQMLTEGMQEIEHQDQTRFLEIITEESERLARLVDDLLEAQRLEGGRARWDLRPHDLSRLVRACALVFDAMAESRSITLHVDCPGELPPVEVDADKMSQVIGNLVSNAIKYTQPGGHVDLSVRATGSEILFCVTDNGPGIPREKWDYIFDRFAQVTMNLAREIGGVGLGLFIVRQIVDRHGGRVWVESEVGQGARFYVALPISRPEQAGEERDAGAASAGRVLVCDADPELAARMSQVLRHHHYDVRCVHAGCRLLSLVVELQPDVVVTDVMLPDVHAADLLRSLADLKSRSKFRLVAHTYVADGHTLQSGGVDVVLARPAASADLLQAVRVAQQRQSPGMTVLVFDIVGSVAEELSARLSAAGHIPIAPQSPSDVLQVAADYPVDVIVLSEAAINSDRSLLSKLRQRRPGAAIYVVVEKVRRATRDAAAALGAELIVWRAGTSAELAARISAAARSEAGAN